MRQETSPLAISGKIAVARNSSMNCGYTAMSKNLVSQAGYLRFVEEISKMQ
jgi:hypothetical protein